MLSIPVVPSQNPPLTRYWGHVPMYHLTIIQCRFSPLFKPFMRCIEVLLHKYSRSGFNDFMHTWVVRVYSHKSGILTSFHSPRIRWRFCSTTFVHSELWYRVARCWSNEIVTLVVSTLTPNPLFNIVPLCSNTRFFFLVNSWTLYFAPKHISLKSMMLSLKCECLFHILSQPLHRIIEYWAGYV